VRDHLIAQCQHDLWLELATERSTRHLVPIARKHEHRTADGVRKSAGHLLEAPLLHDELLEPLVGCDSTLKRLVLLVDEPAESTLRDRDEGHLVRNLEDRELELARRLCERGGNPVVGDAGPKAETHKLMVDQPAHELALGRIRVELKPRRQQQLTASEPGRRIEELGYVNPPDPAVGTLPAFGNREAEIFGERLDREHGAVP
jgi:hypothetical protein